MATSTYPLNGRVSLKGKKIGLFIPCYIDLVYPEGGVATLELLEKLGSMWVSPWIRLAADSRCPTVGTRRTRSPRSGYLSPTSKTSTALSGRILVLALPIWQTPATAEHNLELTLWQALACAVGTVVNYCGRSSLSLATPA